MAKDKQGAGTQRTETVFDNTWKSDSSISSSLSSHRSPWATDSAYKRLVQPFFNALLPSVGPQHSTPERPFSAISTQLQSNGAANLPPIRIICISDTHNATPLLPPGDILIHSGDLTVRGTLEEVQAQLRWLHSQPHPHKIVIAENHDLLIDEACDDRFPTRGDRDAEDKRARLDWDGIVYLQNEAVNLEVTI
ncbi:hypothetical protein BDW69DRAFT_183953 [Aspergillus filifer]